MTAQTVPAPGTVAPSGLGNQATEPTLRVHRISINGCVICRPVGTLDAFSVSLLREVTSDLSPGTRLILDLSALSFLDSAGLGALIGAARKVNDTGGAANVVAPRDVVRQLLLDMGFERVAPVFATANEAVDAHLASVPPALPPLRKGAPDRLLRSEPAGFDG